MCAKLVPGDPCSGGIWSLVFHIIRFRGGRAAGVVPKGPDSERG